MYINFVGKGVDKMENEILETVETGNEETKTYTQEEVLKLIQAEADKRVQQALKTQQRKFDKQLSLSQLDDEAREKAMKDDRIAELEAQLKEFNQMQVKAEVTKVLASRGLDSRLVDVLNLGEDVTEAQEKIDLLDKIIKGTIAKEVKSRIGDNTPKASTTGLDGNITKEQFRKMSIAEQMDLYNNNPELYKELTRR